MEWSARPGPMRSIADGPSRPRRARTRWTSLLLRASTRPGRTSRGRRGIDHGAVPMLDQLAVADAEGVKRKYLVKRSCRCGGILSIVPVNDRHEIALGHHDLEGIPGRRLRTSGRWGWRLASPRAPSRTALPRATESRLEVFVVAEPGFLAALEERGVVLLVGWIGESQTISVRREERH